MKKAKHIYPADPVIKTGNNAIQPMKEIRILKTTVQRKKINNPKDTDINTQALDKLHTHSHNFIEVTFNRL